METWEKLIVGIIVVILLLWFFPGIKPMIEKSKDAPKDWSGLLIPIGLVIVFVFFLIATI